MTDVLLMNNTSQASITVPSTAGGTVVPGSTLALQQNNYKLVSIEIDGVLTTTGTSLAQNVIFELRNNGVLINQTNPVFGTGGAIDITKATHAVIDDQFMHLVFNVTQYSPGTLTVTMRGAGTDGQTSFVANSILALGYN